MKEPLAVDFPLPVKLKKLLESFRAFMLATQPVKGIGIGIDDMPGGKGRVISAASGIGTGGAAQPWKCRITQDGDNVIAEIAEGKLYEALDEPEARDFEADGLTFPAYTGIIESGTKIMLRIDFDPPGQIRGASTVCYLETSSGEWSAIELQEWDEDNESETYDQILVGRIPLAEVEGTGGNLAIRQIAKNDWWMINTNFAGRVAPWPSQL